MKVLKIKLSIHIIKISKLLQILKKLLNKKLNKILYNKKNNLNHILKYFQLLRENKEFLLVRRL